MSTVPPGPGPAQPPTAPPTAPAEASPPPPRRALVLLMILTTAALFVGLFAVLYLKWAGAQEPSSALVVTATPAFDGAEIVVEGVALPKPYRVRVDARRRKSIPFYLDRGSYTLRITLDDQPIYSYDFILEANRMLKLDLSQVEDRLPTTAPAARTDSTPTADDAATIQASTRD
jgi:hypothetical protein